MRSSRRLNSPPCRLFQIFPLLSHISNSGFPHIPFHKLYSTPNTSTTQLLWLTLVERVLTRLILVQKFNILHLEMAAVLRRRAQWQKQKKHTSPNINLNPHLPKPVWNNHRTAMAVLEKPQLLTCPPSTTTKIMHLLRTCHISVFEMKLSQQVRLTTNEQPNVQRQPMLAYRRCHVNNARQLIPKEWLIPLETHFQTAQGVMSILAKEGDTAQSSGGRSRARGEGESY